jgi:hypothetical protein
VSNATPLEENAEGKINNVATLRTRDVRFRPISMLFL